MKRGLNAGVLNPAALSALRLSLCRNFCSRLPTSRHLFYQSLIKSIIGSSGVGSTHWHGSHRYGLILSLPTPLFTKSASQGLPQIGHCMIGSFR